MAPRESWRAKGQFSVGGLGRCTMIALDADTQRVYHRHMTKKLIRHGNSAAIILDKPILDLLNLTMDTPLQISTDGQSIVISPATAGSEDQFRASLDRINSQFSTTLSRLGE